MINVVVYKNFIGGKWINSTSKNTFISVNPANGKILGKFQESNSEDVHQAVKEALLAQIKWRDVPAPKRGDILLKVAHALRKNKKRLGQLITKEMGKVIEEGLGDVQEAIDIAEYMAGEGRRLLGYTTPSELPNKFCMTIRQPIGVCGLITPWNFPIAIPSWKIMPALICGNAIVIKPSSETPLCAIELVKILDKAGVPKGVVNLVTGPGDTVGHEIIAHPDIRAISFTGSRGVGKYVTEHAGLKKIGLELGGKNGIIVMDDANIENAVEGILWGGFGTTGQRCTASSRVIVHKKIKEKLEKALLKKIVKLKIGDGLKGYDVGPLINISAVDKVDKYVQIGKEEGAKMLCGGRRLKSKGNYYLPTLFTDVRKNMKIATEEIFGPFISIISVRNIDEAIEVSNAIDYGLSSSIYTNDIRNAFYAIQKLEAGITYVNGSTIGAEVHLPFGGVKDTGNGAREAGIEGIYEFSETKSVYIDYSGKLQRAQIDNAE